LALGVFFIERAIVTSPERIDDDVHDLVESFRKQDLQRTLSHVSESATTERQLISGAIGLVTIADPLRITDMNVKMLDDEHATARFRVNGTADAMGTSRRVSTRWELTFAREGDAWKVTRIQRMKLLKDEVIDPLNMSEI
jgi:hypothetical protein